MSEVIEKAAELVDRAEINASGVLVEYSRTEAALASLRERYAGAKFDLTTTAGDKAARAARLDLVTLRTGLEKKRKELKAPAVEFGKKIDDEAKRITAEIVALEDPIDAQIKADETRRENERLERERIAAERAAGFRAKIEAIRACVTKAHGLTSERIGNGIAQVEAIVTDEVTWAEFAEEAAQAKATTLAAMMNLRDQAKTSEDEAARLEAQRIENERIAAQQKAEADRLAAERAEFERQKAELAAAQAEIEEHARVARQNAEREQREAQERAAAEARRTEEAEREASAAAAFTRELEQRQRETNTPAQAPEHVLKAEAETPDATDPGTPVITSPSVGSMGAGKAADAAPSGGTVRAFHPAAQALRNEQPTLTLGTLKDRLGFTVTADFLAELGFEATAVKASRLYRESQFGDICAALVRHIESVRADAALAA